MLAIWQSITSLQQLILAQQAKQQLRLRRLLTSESNNLWKGNLSATLGLNSSTLPLLWASVEELTGGPAGGRRDRASAAARAIWMGVGNAGGGTSGKAAAVEGRDPGRDVGEPTEGFDMATAVGRLARSCTETTNRRFSLGLDILFK